MINLVDFIQLGVAGILAVVILLVVKAFLETQKKRDELFVESQRIKDELFSKLITNHLSDTNKILREITKSNINLKNAIYNFMKMKNKNKG